MKALVYHGPGAKTWEDVALPELATDSDAIVRVDTTTICGTDLHILKGDVPAMVDGRIIGHEAVGTVTPGRCRGPDHRGRRPGAGVVCQRVRRRDRRYGQCTNGGWILGNEIDGTQAEYVRVPFADNSTYPVPEGVGDEQLLMLADILPTGYEVGVLNGNVQPGDVVVVVGAGPIGLSAISGARLFSPSLIVAIDRLPGRLDAAKQFGADVLVNNAERDPIAAVRDLTGGLGADVAIEAVGVPATFELAVELVRPAGRVANIGVHGRQVTLHLERLWSRDLTITTGLVDTSSTPTLLRLLAAGRIDAARFVTHRFGLDDIIRAYDTFSDAGRTGALKVVLSRV
ncbi:zinc-binding dehydrogenase [Micromonospora chokoriensis]